MTADGRPARGRARAIAAPLCLAAILGAGLAGIVPVAARTAPATPRPTPMPRATAASPAPAVTATPAEPVPCGTAAPSTPEPAGSPAAVTPTPSPATAASGSPVPSATLPASAAPASAAPASAAPASAAPGASEPPVASLPAAASQAAASPLPSPTPSPDPCVPPTPTPTPTPVKPGRVVVERGVAMTPTLPCYELPSTGCVNRADIYHPRNKGGWPTIVTVHGRPRTPADMAELARSLAARGAVVFNVDYRGVRPVSRGYPDAYADIACAVRFARARTERYGGDPSRVILIGHSQGGQVTGVVALAGDRFPGRAGECKAPDGRSLPEGFVHVAGVSINSAGEPINATWFGGSQAAVPERWARGDIYTHMGRNKRLQVGIIFERNDPVLTVDNHALWLQAAFRDHGYRSRLLMLDEGSTHFDILDTDTRLGRKLVDFAWSVVRRTAPR